VARVEVYFRTKWRLHRSSRLATIDISRKLGAVALLEGSWVEAYLRTMWHLDLFSRLATIDMGHKLWGCSLFGEGAGSPSNTVAWAEAYLHTNLHLNPFSHLATIYGPKIGWPVTLWRRGAGSPSNTMWPGSRPTCMPISFILIHPTVWPQYTNFADRTTV